MTAAARASMIHQSRTGGAFGAARPMSSVTAGIPRSRRQACFALSGRRRAGGITRSG